PRFGAPPDAGCGQRCRTQAWPGNTYFSERTGAATIAAGTPGTASDPGNSRRSPSFRHHRPSGAAKQGKKDVDTRKSSWHWSGATQSTGFEVWGAGRRTRGQRRTIDRSARHQSGNGRKDLFRTTLTHAPEPAHSPYLAPYCRDTAAHCRLFPAGRMGDTPRARLCRHLAIRGGSNHRLGSRLLGTKARPDICLWRLSRSGCRQTDGGSRTDCPGPTRQNRCHRRHHHHRTGNHHFRLAGMDGQDRGSEERGRLHAGQDQDSRPNDSDSTVVVFGAAVQCGCPGRRQLADLDCSLADPVVHGLLPAYGLAGNCQAECGKAVVDVDNTLGASIMRALFNAAVAQLVERNLAKVEVESSRLFCRSSFAERSVAFFLVVSHNL